MSAIAYLDNAATTFPKPKSVYDFADEFYRGTGGNIGRGGNAVAKAAGEIERSAKANLLKMYGDAGRQVVFTASATDALNRILLGLGLAEGARVCVTPFEHNAVTRTLQHLAGTAGVAVDVMPFDKDTLLPDIESIKQSFAQCPPAAVVMTHASNVCGAVVPVEEICACAKKHSDTVTVVDMSQTAGLLSLDLRAVDFAIFAGHKTLYAPFGVGGFICRNEARLAPVMFGGNGIDSLNQEMPEDMASMIEVGSKNTYAIAGLKASTDWILAQGMTSVRESEHSAAAMLLDIIRSHSNVRIVADNMRCERTGVVSCLFDGYSPDEAEMVLGRFDVAVRSGIQCSPYAHRFLGTLPAGTVRFSVSALTTNEDLNKLAEALEIMDDM